MMRLQYSLDGGKLRLFIVVLFTTAATLIYMNWKPERKYDLSQYTITNNFVSSDDLVNLNTNISEDKLVNLIQRRWLVAPSRGPLKLKDHKRKSFSQVGQDLMVDSLLKKKKNGFFIECGAADGEFLSNSLYFEKFRHWTGLLIEADPRQFRSLLNKKRYAFSINACLNVANYSQFKPFTLGTFGVSLTGLGEYLKSVHEHYQFSPEDSNKVHVQCFPLVSILGAINVTVVDYFSLDVEGAEMDVLSTIPFDRIIIRVISIEYRIYQSPEEIDQVATLKKFKELCNFFDKTNLYKMVGVIPESISAMGLDVIFQRKVFKKKGKRLNKKRLSKIK